jgi:hypothetical protein
MKGKPKRKMEGYLTLRIRFAGHSEMLLALKKQKVSNAG